MPSEAKKAVYLALGMRADGSRDIRGMWVENTEGTQFWMKIFKDLKTRGVQKNRFMRPSQGVVK